MVKVIDRTLISSEEYVEKITKIEEIAKKYFERLYVNKTLERTRITLFPVEPWSRFNEIGMVAEVLNKLDQMILYDRNYEYSAKKFGKKYEKEFMKPGEEFVINTNYSE